MNLSKEVFENIVEESIENLDEKFKKHINNVAIFVEDFPSLEQMRKTKTRSKWNLLGLFEGYAQAKRLNFGPVLPDKITIFRRPILRACRNQLECKKQITSTLKHEIAHHFGSGEEGARKAGRKT